MTKESPEVKIWQLATADQIAPRAYVRTAVAFPLEEQVNRNTTNDHLKQAVSYVLHAYPFLGGCLMYEDQAANPARQGRLLIQRKTPYDEAAAVKQVFHTKNHLSKINKSYEEIRDADFSTLEIFSTRLAPGSSENNLSEGCSPFLVQANYFRGGLLLAIYLHHSICDGGSTGQVMNLLAEATRIDKLSKENFPLMEYMLCVPHIENAIPIVEGSPSEIEERYKDNDPWCVLPGPTGPTQTTPATSDATREPVITRQFIFADEMLADLCERVNELPENRHIKVTKNDCMGSLIWIFTIYARYMTSNGPIDEDTSKLLIPVNCRSRLQPPLPLTYFGNAAVTPVARMDLETLLRAHTEASKNREVAYFGHIARTIRRAINTANLKLVMSTLEMGRNLPDIRRMGLNVRCEDGLGLQYNTWAGLGADFAWGLSGVVGVKTLSNGTKVCVKPDAVRKVHLVALNGSNLVQPRRQGSSEWVVQVQARPKAMEWLEQDKGLRRMVLGIAH